ncbi:unnamed protein product [Phytophthora lilii]|uniref:Unnamed protein product n=1 Tax=Phytophthora lilii TaxID=2077276 RepID=A0A9W6U7P9_9STRA|nr:unnamed protein product [Phytophthora lilii]
MTVVASTLSCEAAATAAAATECTTAPPRRPNGGWIDNNIIVQRLGDLYYGGTTQSLSASEATGNSCANDGNGIADYQFYGDGVTPVLISTLYYDTNAGACSSSAIPTQLKSSVVPGNMCTPSIGCSDMSTIGVYTSTSCLLRYKYASDVALQFGSTPYIIVENYSGNNCGASALAGISTYVADGKCHKSDTTASFRAVRMSNGNVAIILFANSVCDLTFKPQSLSVTSDQVSGGSCVPDPTGKFYMKLFASGTTPTYWTSKSYFDTNTTTCGSSLQTYQSNVAAMYGSTPFVILEKYKIGTNCAATNLMSITTYVADGKCHRTDSTSSFRALRKADGSAVVYAYSNSVTCSSNTGVFVSDKANSCVDGGDGVFSVKIYGGGVTPLHLKLTSYYDSNVGGLTYMTSSTFQSDIAAAFGSMPYLIMEQYQGTSCGGSLLNVKTYVADGLCHKSSTPTSSYQVTRSADGVVTIKTFSTSTTCASVTSINTITATGDQVRDHTSETMPPKPKPDSLFRWVEEREREQLEASGSSWGRVLDSGTGRHSLSWLLRGDASALLSEVVAVTGEKALASELTTEFGPGQTPHATPLKVLAGNWQNAKFLANEKPFDVIIAAIEGFAPYYQDQICARLEKLLAPGGRIYLVGLQPLSESQCPAGASEADQEAGKLVQEVARTRDACLLLAGRRCYREYPVDWSQRQLEKAGLEVTNSVRLANIYGRSAITRQLEVGRRHIPMFKDSELADSMQQALDRVDERLEEEFGSGGLPKEEQRRIRFGFDYVIAARKPVQA